MDFFKNNFTYRNTIKKQFYFYRIFEINSVLNILQRTRHNNDLFVDILFSRNC